MDIFTIVSLIFAFGSLIVGFLLEEGQLSALVQVSAFIIIFGGTFGAVAVSFPGRIFKKFPKVLAIAFKKRDSKIGENIRYFKEISIRTRREGLLILEGEVTNDGIDPFIKKGFQLAADGTEQSVIQGILETELEQMADRHDEGIEMFSAAGGYSPTMGIIGTVMGLLQVVANLDDPLALGVKIAAAFMATLYGIAMANLFWLPIANKLKMLNKEEINEKQMIIEAVLLIQQGSNTNSLVSKLEGYMLDDDKKSLLEDKQV
ncbi:motility protein A [Clostridium cellulovorans]|uniref:MotA/TolQ/ExbB proton channel n=1 Tax=Clostridium cellulovorans (strain ATCC 35296 / DSM 3052 / OCM 3 / 743B) TaxID=573061 RepID=D9SNP0_CLOC7|nr:motility protein A [Clostridium cellulovorans]ADL49911.1 MotA/TolQ/ExbB proton channel [Clostridium cellulovorans 743B]